MTATIYLLGWLIAGTRGGLTRAEIIKAIHETPQNANQLATALKVDYKTASYPLEVLEKNRIVTSVGTSTVLHTSFHRQ